MEISAIIFRSVIYLLLISEFRWNNIRFLLLKFHISFADKHYKEWKFFSKYKNRNRGHKKENSWMQVFHTFYTSYLINCFIEAIIDFSWRHYTHKSILVLPSKLKYISHFDINRSKTDFNTHDMLLVLQKKYYLYINKIKKWLDS